MKLNLDSEWQAILADEIEKPYFHDLMEKVDEEYKLHACYPPKDLVFSITAVLGKVVIIGQDPYHGKGRLTDWLSVNDGIRIPPLRNIFKEISDDLGTIFLPGSGNLEPWASVFT
jgi:uracil-DNA glycosylase